MYNHNEGGPCMIYLSNEVKKYLRLRAIIFFITTFIVFGLIILVTMYLDFHPLITFVVLGILLLIQLILFVFLKPYIYQKVTQYKVYENRVVTVEGFIFIHHKMLPLKRVQGVEMRHGLISRKYNLARLSVTTAGTMFHLPPLTIEEAKRVQKEMVDLVKGEFIDV